MKATLVAVFFMFGSVMMVIAVAPVVIEETSGRSSDAGFVTAVFAAATVLTDLAMPRLLHTRTASWLLAIGIVVIGASAPLFAVGSDNVAVMLAASAVRGVGFALGSVTASLFVINLAPEAQRGRALGFYGVAATVPAILAPSLGLILLDSFGVGSAFGVAGVLGLLGAVAAARGRSERAVDAGEEAAHSSRVLRSALANSSVRRPFLVSLIAMVGFGGIISYVPLVLPSSGAGSAAIFFLVAGTSRAVLRWTSGGVIDRRGATAPLLAGLLAAIAGSALLISDPGSVRAIVAALTVGAGLGIVLNAGYLAMIRAAAKGTLGAISALWNISIDAGFGLGALVLGVVAATSVDGVFIVLPLLMVIGLPVAVRAHRATSGDRAG